MDGNPPTNFIDAGESGAGEKIILTGATGFLGRHIFKELLRKLPKAEYVLPVRVKGGGPAVERWREIAPWLGQTGKDAPPMRLKILPADITREKCGLCPDDYRQALSGLTRIIHAAADVQFDRPLEEARRINVEGTRRLLEMGKEAAASGRFSSFSYVGTAFVAGEREGLVYERDLDAGQTFRNTYERTKAEAEALVRQASGHLPVIIARPSIIVGHSRTGITSSFKMLYWPLMVYTRGWWRTVPGYPEAVVDIVPVDFVSEAVAQLAIDGRAAGRTFHLCAGPKGSATIREIGERAASFFNRPPPRYVNPTIFLALLRPIFLAVGQRRKKRVIRKGHVYRPYFRTKTLFDTTQAEELLGPAGIRVPPVMDYIDNIFRYGAETDWGRRSSPQSKQGKYVAL